MHCRDLEYITNRDSSDQSRAEVDMNTCVASWEFLHDNNLALLPPPSTHCNSTSPPPETPMLGNELSELRWVNGQLAMQGFDTTKRVDDSKPVSTTTTATATTTTLTNDNHSWANPNCNGTLEAIVDQAHRKSAATDDCVPWFMAAPALLPLVVAAPAATTTATIPLDAAVPCSGSTQDPSSHVLGGAGGRCVVASSTRVESCSAGTFDNMNGRNQMKRAKMTAVADYSSRDNSVSGTMDSQQITLDTCEWELEGHGGFTGTSIGSPGNTSSANKTATDDRDSVGHSRPQRGAGDEEKEKKKVVGGKGSISTKRSRAAAVHNQSERKRRDKINEKMKTLQKLVPHASKSDKASMLDEVIEYLKNLQAQIHMMSRMGMSPMNMNPMMMPLAMQMSMMPQMGMGMGMNPMGMGMMDMNAMGRPNVPGLPPPVLHPNPFMPMQPPQWDMTAATTNAASASVDRVLPAPAGRPLVPAPPGPPLVPDPISTSLLAFQTQPLTLEGYSKMAALFQQMNQNPISAAKS